MISAKRLLNHFGSTGILKIPSGPPVYNVDTGDTTTPYEDHDILYVPYPVTSEDLGNFGLAAFDGSFMTFMFTNQDRSTQDVRTTAFIDDINSDRYDIQGIQYIRDKDEIIAYQCSTMVAR